MTFEEYSKLLDRMYELNRESREQIYDLKKRIRELEYRVDKLERERGER